ncbi:MAG: hypothetical protein OEM61_11570 [Desulfobacteraceae bacterium]|nr:hypothetical protein [Desulfobacteraceae bacterium]
MSRYKEIDLTQMKTYSASERASKFKTTHLAAPPYVGMTMREFLDGLPSVLKADDLKALALAIINARNIGKPVVVMIGGHVIKTGCSPILIDLAEKGYITHFAANGSAAVHDTEISLFGHTSEDVEAGLEDGSFGMASDTALLINEAAKKAVDSGLGFGEAVGFMLKEENPPFLKQSLIANCFLNEIPFTLHVAIGTDIVHQHPSAEGANIGEASLRDFRILAATISEIGEGGVVLNIGSAVIMPEVFLKTLAIARNIKRDIKDFTTANFDMIQHYRPNINVLKRPVSLGGKFISITGHHEIMIPLLASTVYEYAK